MRILVVDFWFGVTHKRLNIRTIEVLSKVFDVTVTDYNRYYGDSLELKDKVKFIPVNCNNRTSNKITRRIREIKNIINTARAIRNVDYDAVLVTGYEVTCAFVASFLFRKNRPLVLQYHQHVDQVSNGLKRIIFSIYKNRMFHCFLEEEYADFFKTVTRVSDNRVFVVHHPILSEIRNDHEGNTILGISSSNDLDLIKKVIESEKKLHVLENNKIKLILRAKGIEYKSESIDVNNRFLSAEEYEKLFDDSDTILVAPKKQEFRHRVSGTIYDAIASGKKVLGIDISIMRIMKSIAPSMFYILNENDLLNSIVEASKKKIVVSELENVRRRHSDEQLGKEYREMFETVVK